MRTRTIILTAAAAALLAAGASPILAHQTRGSMMQQGQPDADMMRTYPDWMGSGMMSPGFMMGPGMMMGGGMMGHGMSHMMIIMMDTNGDGALSLEEFEAVHVRMFNTMDVDGDGNLTSREMDTFMDGDWMEPDDDM